MACLVQLSHSFQLHHDSVVRYEHELLRTQVVEVLSMHAEMQSPSWTKHCRTSDGQSGYAACGPVGGGGTPYLLVEYLEWYETCLFIGAMTNGFH